MEKRFLRLLYSISLIVLVVLVGAIVYSQVYHGAFELRQSPTKIDTAVYKKGDFVVIYFLIVNKEGKDQDYLYNITFYYRGERHWSNTLHVKAGNDMQTILQFPFTHNNTRVNIKIYRKEDMNLLEDITHY